MNKNSIDSSINRHGQRYHLWKAGWLVCLPLAIIYQLLWGILFNYVPDQFWVSGASQQVFVLKLTSEFVIYSLMLWFLLSKTHTAHMVGKVLAGLLLTAIILYTMYGLFNELAKVTLTPIN